MKKKELIVLLCFLVVSTIYNFRTPTETVESIEVIKEITIYVEGKTNGVYVFDHNPTIQDVFVKAQLSNTYGFEDSYVLTDKQFFYIPENIDGLVSLNNATLEEFLTLKGIGPKTAQKIIDQRNVERYSCIEDIMKVSGIGEKRYYAIRGYLCL